MEVDEGSGSYGFARRNNQVHKKIGRSTTVQSDAPVAPKNYVAPSQQPIWVWLLIGFLLGTGGTLLMASFWLPASGDHHIATPESGDRPSPENDGVAAATVTEQSLQEEVRNEPQFVGTSVATLDVENSAIASPADAASPDTDDLSEAPADLIQGSSPSAGEPLSETLLSAAAQNAEDDVKRRPIDDDRSTGPSGPEQALSALVSKTAASETPLLPSPLDDRSSNLAPERPDRGERALSPPEDPIFAAKPNDGPKEVVDPQPRRSEAASSNDAGRSELPPRIKQALQAAKEESRSTTGTKAQSNTHLYRVQLAAVDNEAAARVFWQEVNERLPGVFADVEPIFNQRLVDERLYLRIWVGAFDSRPDADGYCGWLKLKGQDCFVTRVDTL